MKILLLGANGQVGWELQRSLLPLGEVKACDRNTADLADLDGLRELIRDYSPDVIVNAAAYTAVDKAELDIDTATLINTTAVGLLADEAKKLNAWLIHYSTDYVFDGTKDGIYTEIDSVNPQSVYGSTKLKGEEFIKQSACKHLIFRTSWVYANRGANFAKTMIRLAQEKDALSVVSDQIGVPTSAELIADVTAHCIYQIRQNTILAQDATGIYNLVPNGEVSWYSFAQFVIKQAQVLGCEMRFDADEIKPIMTSEYPLPAKRPLNSKLDTKKIRNTFNIYLPEWQIHASRMINELNL
jgi:dTDP-4-dehydrorhamnose reductase